MDGATHADAGDCLDQVKEGCLVAGAGDEDVAEARIDKAGMDAGIGVHKVTLGGEVLGTVADDGIGMVEVPHFRRVKRDRLLFISVPGDSDFPASSICWMAPFSIAPSFKHQRLNYKVRWSSQDRWQRGAHGRQRSCRDALSRTAQVPPCTCDLFIGLL